MTLIILLISSGNEKLFVLITINWTADKIAIIALLMSTPHFHSLKFLPPHPIHQTNNKNSLEKLTKAFHKQWWTLKIVLSIGKLSRRISQFCLSQSSSVGHPATSARPLKKFIWTLFGTMSMHVVCAAKKSELSVRGNWTQSNKKSTNKKWSIVFRRDQDTVSMHVVARAGQFWNSYFPICILRSIKLIRRHTLNFQNEMEAK